MMDPKAFGYKGAASTCLWCGQRLAEKRLFVERVGTGRYAPPSSCYACDVRELIPGEFEEAGQDDHRNPLFRHRICGTEMVGREIETLVRSDAREKGGYGGNETFCSLRCGNAFALALARGGLRLKMQDGKLVYERGQR